MNWAVWRGGGILACELRFEESGEGVLMMLMKLLELCFTG